MARHRHAAVASVAVRVGRVARNIAADARMGSWFAGELFRRDGSADNRERGNSDHAALGQIFAGRVSPDDVLVDVGCGPGRVIAFWRRAYPDNRIVGLELNASLARRASRHFRHSAKVTIIAGDAVDNLPEDGNVFYLFNPFGREDVARLEARLRSLRDAGRRFRVLYHNPKHLDVFADRGAWECERVELRHSRHLALHPLAVIRPAGVDPGVARA